MLWSHLSPSIMQHNMHPYVQRRQRNRLWDFQSIARFLVQFCIDGSALQAREWIVDLHGYETIFKLFFLVFGISWNLIDKRLFNRSSATCKIVINWIGEWENHKFPLAIIPQTIIIRTSHTYVEALGILFAVSLSYTVVLHRFKHFRHGCN